MIALRILTYTYLTETGPYLTLWEIHTSEIDRCDLSITWLQFPQCQVGYKLHLIMQMPHKNAWPLGQ